MAYNSLDVGNAPMKHAADAVAVVTSGSALTGYITGWAGALAAVLTVAWFSYQIYDLWDRRRRRKALAEKRKKK